MKERYISPSLVLIGFAPEERIAREGIDFDDLIGGGENQGHVSAVTPGDDDIDVGRRG